MDLTTNLSSGNDARRRGRFPCQIFPYLLPGTGRRIDAQDAEDQLKASTTASPIARQPTRFAPDCAMSAVR
jgi:hypothetical protein